MNGLLQYPLKRYKTGFICALPALFFLLFAGCEHSLDAGRDLVELVYTVKITPAIENGSIKAMPAKGIVGTEITVAINPKPGYRLKDSSLYGYEGGAAEKYHAMTTPPYRFSLARNTTLFAEFEPIAEGQYTVTVDETIQGGTIVPYGKSREGNNITITTPDGLRNKEIFLMIYPDPGYSLKEDSVKWDGMPLSAPFEFLLPNRNVVITAEFVKSTAADFIQNGKKALYRDDYDSAVAAFDEAYRLDPNNPEAIFFSTLGRLASIAIDVNVRKIAASIGMSSYPLSLNNMFLNDTLNNGDAWDNYFDIADNWTHQRPRWLTDYAGGKRLWNVNHSPTGYYAMQNQDYIWFDSYSKVNNQQPTMATFYIATFFNLMGTNISSWNDVLDNTLKYAFGDAFEAASSRAAKLSYTDAIVLDQTLVEKLFMQDHLQGGDTVGRAELELLFASLRTIKAGLEWVSAYDLNMDRSMFRFINNIPKEGPLAGVIDMFNRKYVGPADLIGDFTNNTDAINNIIGYVFQIMDDRFARDLRVTGLTGMIPLRNNFLRERSGASAALNRSKADLLKAIEALVEVDTHYNNSPGAASQLVDEWRLHYSWVSAGLARLQTAARSGGDFYFHFPNVPASGSAWDYTFSSVERGINFNKLYTPGQLSLDKLLTVENGGKKPKFYGWGVNTSVPGSYITGVADTANYEWIGFELNLNSLKQVFVKGIEKDGRILNDQEYVHTVFPDILLKTANGKKLYEAYYDRYDYSSGATGN
ncbi:hypothetical protein AGMMS49991_08830 [Spirochaetia bacterium]|nr:hypothetical protein AGMMS49991_08830 [Spirochaetia bacterium]